jgi:hypothetical protein
MCVRLRVSHVRVGRREKENRNENEFENKREQQQVRLGCWLKFYPKPKTQNAYFNK